MSIIEASTDKHFLLDGKKLPKRYIARIHGFEDARIEYTNSSGSVVVPLGSTVGGVEPATQADLVDALAAIVTPDSSTSSESAAAIGAAVNTLPDDAANSTLTFTAGEVKTIAATTRLAGSLLQNDTTGLMRTVEGTGGPAPVIAPTQSFSISESASVGASIGTVSASNATGYSMTGATNPNWNANIDGSISNKRPWIRAVDLALQLRLICFLCLGIAVPFRSE